MNSSFERFKTDVDKVIRLGNEMLLDVHFRSVKEESLASEDREVIAQIKGKFEKNYQRWYTESYSLIKQLLPYRLPEFVRLYEGEGKRKEISITNFTIQDWLNGWRPAGGAFDDLSD